MTQSTLAYLPSQSEFTIVRGEDGSVRVFLPPTRAGKIRAILVAGLSRRHWPRKRIRAIGISRIGLMPTLLVQFGFDPPMRIAPIQNQAQLQQAVLALRDAIGLPADAGTK